MRRSGLVKRATRRLLSLLARMLIGVGRFISRSRPARWIAGQSVFKFVVRIIIVSARFLEERIWRTRRYFHFLSKGIRRSRWFCFSWMIFLALVAGSAVGVLIILNPKLAAILVLGLLFAAFLIVKPFEAFLIWIVLSPLLYTSVGPSLGFMIPDITFDRMALPGLLLVVVIQKMRRGGQKPKLDFLDMAVAGFVIVGVINIVMTRLTVTEMLVSDFLRMRDLTASIRSFGDHYLLAFATFYIVRNLVDSKQKIGAVMTAIVLVAVYSAPIGIYEHIVGKSWFTATGELGGYGDEMVARAGGPFRSPFIFGAVMGACLIMAIHKYLEWKTLRKYLLLPLMSAIGISLALTYTRTAWIAPGVGLITLAILYESKRRLLMTCVALGLITLLLVMPMIQAQPILKARISEQAPINARILIWHNSVEMFKDKPLFGVGVGNFNYFKRFYPVYMPELGQRYQVGPTSHNTFMTILVEVGLIGFLPYAAILLIVAWRWLVTYRRCPGILAIGGRELVATIGVSTICYLITANTMDTRSFRFVMYLFWLLLGLICVQYGMLKKQPVGEIEGEKQHVDHPRSRRISRFKVPHPTENIV